MEPSAKCTNSKYLQTLLEMCFLQFEDVVAAHSVLLSHLQKTKMTYKGKNITQYYYHSLSLSLSLSLSR